MADLFEIYTRGYIPADAELTRAEENLKIIFPPSYRAFCSTYGSGVIGGLYMIYVPRKDLDDIKSITHRARVLRDRLEDNRTFWREEDMTVGVDVWEGVDDTTIVDRALFIGQSFNGEQIFWDVNGQGEYKIFVENDSTVRFGGDSLDEFIHRTLTPEIKMIFGPGYEPLPSQFEGRD